jgi:tetratricopeptide (TPR) repeat protein
MMMSERKEITSRQVVELLVKSALVAKLLTEYRDSEARLERAGIVARASGLKDLESYVLSEKSGLYYKWGRYDDGLALAELVFSTGAAADEKHLASALNTAGNIHLRRCRFQEAERCFLQALEHFRRLKMEISVGTAINNLANIYNIRGDLQQARQFYLEALDRFERQNDIYRTAHAMYSISQILLALKKTDQAKEYLDKSSELRRSIQDYRGMANNLLMQIGIFAEEKDFDGAREKLRQADDVIREYKLTDPHLNAYREGEAGAFYFLAGEYDKAECSFLRMIDLSKHMKEASYLAGSYSWLGRTRVFRDNNEAGVADIKKGLALAGSSDLPYELKSAWGYLVECYCRLGDEPQAEIAAQEYAVVALKQGLNQQEIDSELLQLRGQQQDREQQTN